MRQAAIGFASALVLACGAGSEASRVLIPLLAARLQDDVDCRLAAMDALKHMAKTNIEVRARVCVGCLLFSS